MSHTAGYGQMPAIVQHGLGVYHGELPIRRMAVFDVAGWTAHAAGMPRADCDAATLPQRHQGRRQEQQGQNSENDSFHFHRSNSFLFTTILVWREGLAHISAKTSSVGDPPQPPFSPKFSTAENFRRRIHTFEPSPTPLRNVQKQALWVHTTTHLKMKISSISQVCKG